jgi:hypothetical protein
MTNNYLPLTEYSSKYKVSISTLRRRIKTKDIKFRFDQGKYFIYDEPTQRPSLDSVNSTSNPSQGIDSARSKVSGAYRNFDNGAGRPSSSRSAEKVTETFSAASEMKEFFAGTPTSGIAHTLNQKADEPILTAANRLLTELKKAYTQILHEKEEQVLHLKEEVSDLKTLVRVLESENERLKKF